VWVRVPALGALLVLNVVVTLDYGRAQWAY
jgi:hypothetical protein